MTKQEQQTFKNFTDECVNKMASHMNMTPHQGKVASCHNKEVAEQVFNFVFKKWNEWKSKQQ